MKIKLCGFSEIDSLKYAVDCGCDFIGVVFVKKSLRFVDPQKSALLGKNISNKTSKVAIVSNQSLDELKIIHSNFSPHLFQLHGTEDIEYILKLKNIFPSVGIIKAISIKDLKDLDKINFYQNYVDYFLFDSKEGGSGKSFDWKILSNIKISKPWFLSGGINIFNLEDAQTKTNAKFFDLSSGIEEQRGIKSKKLIHEVMLKFNQLRANSIN